jgi:hypothetical protein
MAKIHCEDKNKTHWTNCGRHESKVLIVGGYIFDCLQDKHKCKQCKKREIAYAFEALLKESPNG